MSDLASKVLKKCHNALTEGDEEMVYVFLQQYLNLFITLRDRQEFESDKKLIYTLVGRNVVCEWSIGSASADNKGPGKTVSNDTLKFNIFCCLNHHKKCSEIHCSLPTEIYCMLKPCIHIRLLSVRAPPRHIPLIPSSLTSSLCNLYYKKARRSTTQSHFHSY